MADITFIEAGRAYKELLLTMRRLDAMAAHHPTPQLLWARFLGHQLLAVSHQVRQVEICCGETVRRLRAQQT